ncbi:MAG TPA: TetR/AcrR family transcriptional regulator [Aliidongia sp.]|nr:TetR/AcrR family transcriptional regulator [Aliidongia sp.]
MPARPKFTRAQLQQAALRIVDEKGLDALSMRALAGALGTGPMTFYNYFRDRDELDALLVEAVMAETRLPPANDDWRLEVRAILVATWRAVGAHPNAIPLILTRRTSQAATLDIAEALLQALARGGRSGAALFAAFRTLLGFVMGLAQIRLAAPHGAADPNVVRVASLPEDRYPKVREAAYAAALTDADRDFEAGLDIIMAGLG